MNDSLQNTSCLFEGMTSINAVFSGIDQGHNDRQIEKIFFDRTKLSSKSRTYRFLESKANVYHYELILSDPDDISKLSSGKTHGGILAQCSLRTIPSIKESRPDGSFWAFIEGVEDPYNFGSSIRSLYAAGVNGIVLSERNWMETAGIVCRASAGASEILPLYKGSVEDIVRTFKECGFSIVCAGIRDSVSMTEANLTYPLLLVVGGEKRGISSHLIQNASQIVRIDYGRTFNGSLDTASSVAVLAFEILRQNNSSERTE